MFRIERGTVFHAYYLSLTKNEKKADAAGWTKFAMYDQGPTDPEHAT